MHSPSNEMAHTFVFHSSGNNRAVPRRAQYCNTKKSQSFLQPDSHWMLNILISPNCKGKCVCRAWGTLMPLKQEFPWSSTSEFCGLVLPGITETFWTTCQHPELSSFLVTISANLVNINSLFGAVQRLNLLILHLAAYQHPIWVS